MSNATHDSRDSGDSRRRRSRGGSNRNRNNNNNNERRQEGGGERGPRDSRNRDHSRGEGRKESTRAEEFRPQAPRRTYAPPKKTLWQKILSIFGLYKDPIPPSRLERAKSAPETPVREKTTADARPPKSNTRNARTGESEARPPREAREPREPREQRESREPRADGERRQKERAPRGERTRGGDPKSVESTRVYVGNLSYDVTEQDLQELFKGIGGVRNVEIVYNRSTHRSKGYGFVEMLRMDEAVRSVEVLNDQFFMGRQMTVSGAKSKGQDEREDNDERVESKPVVLASTNPPVVVAENAPVAETAAPEAAVEVSEPDIEPAPVETAEDLAAKYAFDDMKEKAPEA